jgi:general secretion pathway protein N
MTMGAATKSSRSWPLLWAIVVAVLVGVLAIEHYFGRTAIGEGARSPAKVVEAKLLPPFGLPPGHEAGAETTSRPLFVPARRPAPPAASSGPSSIKRGQFVLQGTTILGALRIAMLKEVGSGAVHRVEKGSEILGMTLAEVAPDQVILRAGDDSETLPLVVAKTAGSPAATQQGPFGPSAQAPVPAGMQPAAPVPGSTASQVPMQAGQPPARPGAGSVAGSVGGSAPTPVDGAAPTALQRIESPTSNARRRAARPQAPQ